VATYLSYLFEHINEIAVVGDQFSGRIAAGTGACVGGTWPFAVGDAIDVESILYNVPWSSALRRCVPPNVSTFTPFSDRIHSRRHAHDIHP
jgi:hypothetical protein